MTGNSLPRPRQWKKKHTSLKALLYIVIPVFLKTIDNWNNKEDLILKSKAFLKNGGKHLGFKKLVKPKHKNPWPRRDSNTQPSDLESDALPLRHEVLGVSCFFHTLERQFQRLSGAASTSFFLLLFLLRLGLDCEVFVPFIRRLFKARGECKPSSWKQRARGTPALNPTSPTEAFRERRLGRDRGKWETQLPGKVEWGDRRPGFSFPSPSARGAVQGFAHESHLRRNSISLYQKEHLCKVEPPSLLCSTGNYTPYFVFTYKGREFEIVYLLLEYR